MAGVRAESRLTQTNDQDDIMCAIENIPINGYGHFFNSVKIA